VEALFIAAVDVNNPNSIQAPSLVDFPVERTLWTVVDARRSRGASQSAADEESQLLVRLRHSTAVLEQAADALSQSDPEQLRAWFVPWSRRNSAMQAAFVREQAISGGVRSQEREMLALAQQSQAIAQKLGALRYSATATFDNKLPLALADVLDNRLQAGPAVARETFDGEANSFALPNSQPLFGPWMPRLLAGIFVVLLAVGGYRLYRWTAARDLLACWPQIVGVLVGLLWWFLLQPAVIGLVIVVIAAALSLRWPWPAQRRLTSTRFSLARAFRSSP
jgi:hypothetical protein